MPTLIEAPVLIFVYAKSVGDTKIKARGNASEITKYVRLINIMHTTSFLSIFVFDVVFFCPKFLGV